jgi:hypothetical protein
MGIVGVGNGPLSDRARHFLLIVNWMCLVGRQLTYKMDGQQGECEAALPLMVTHPLSCHVEALSRDFMSMSQLRGLKFAVGSSHDTVCRAGTDDTNVTLATRAPIILASHILCTAPVPLKIVGTEMKLVRVPCRSLAAHKNAWLTDAGCHCRKRPSAR